MGVILAAVSPSQSVRSAQYLRMLIYTNLAKIAKRVYIRKMS